MSATTPAATRSVPGSRDHLLETVEREHATTMRVLRAYPNDHWELRPHAMCKTARELAFVFVMEKVAMQTVMTTGFDFSKPPTFPPAPESADTILMALEENQAKTEKLLRALNDEDLGKPVQFFVGPGQIGDLPLFDVLWKMTCDQIHHRGQFSIYLRMAGGKVPSIYGPSAVEPWR